MKLAILLIVSLFATLVTASKDSTVEALISQINELYNNIQNVINGILATGTLFGRDAVKGIFDSLYELAFPVINPLVQSVSLSIAQTLLTVSNEGLVGLLGKRGIFDSLYELAFPVINPLVQSVSLSIAQTLLTVSNEGLVGLLGKRDDLKGIWDFLTDAVNVIYQPIDNLAISLSSMLVHVFAGIAVEGLPAPGKRDDLKGIWDFLTDAVNVIYQPIDNLAISLSSMLVHVFAGIAVEGLPAPGRNIEDYKGIWDFLTDAVNVIYQPIDNLAISLSSMLVHVFAGIAVEGLPAPGRSL